MWSRAVVCVALLWVWCTRGPVASASATQRISKSSSSRSGVFCLDDPGCFSFVGRLYTLVTITRPLALSNIVKNLLHVRLSAGPFPSIRSGLKNGRLVFLEHLRWTSWKLGSEHKSLLFKFSSQTSRVSCRTWPDIVSEVHDVSPLLSATRSANRSNQVVARDWRLHVHGSALSLWCWNCVQNGRLMWHVSICGEWFA